MNRFYIFILILLSVFVSAQENDFHEAKRLFNNQQYSAAQSLFQKILDQNEDSKSAYYNARCSKELFLSDAISLYNQYQQDYPYSLFLDNVYEDLALIYFRQKKYDQAILYFYKIDDIEQRNDLIFKLAYAHLSIDSLNEALYYFCKLVDIDSKYSSTSRYYCAHIYYKEGLYRNALTHFTKLLNDVKFRKIVPYYISQIYFLEKEYLKLVSFLEPIIDDVILSRSSEMNRLLADSYYYLKDYNRAIIYFNKFVLDNEEVTPTVYFLLGKSYFNLGDYSNAVNKLEKVVGLPDSVMQNSTYYLAASYLKINNSNYALQAFKKVSSYDCNRVIQEDAYFNYAKLSYQLDLPFDNTIEILDGYLDKFNNPLHVKVIENLMVKALKGTSKYLEAFNVLKDIHIPDKDQQESIQQLSYFLGVGEYNSRNYKEAITYFNYGSRYSINPTYSYLINFWMADSYYQLSEYDYSASLYSSLIPPKESELEYYELLQKYNLAYCYFQQKDYVSSNKYFRIFEKNTKDSLYLNDTYLRLADGFFMLNKYDLANKYYQEAVLYNIFDIDYAIYNRSVVAGLLSKDQLKIELLNNLLDNYQSSSYYDDALLDIAKYYKNSGESDLSLTYYDKLISLSNDVDLITKSRISRGMIYFSIDSINMAIKEFLFVVNNSKNKTYLMEALSGLQSAYSSIAKIEEYISLVDTLLEFSISKAEQDSLTYNAAFMKFSEEDYLKASRTFMGYIDKFQDGVFIDDANYYGAVSFLNNGDTVQATLLYEEIIRSEASMYRENALVFLARKYYKKGDFIQSNKYYKEIEIIASTNSLRREAVIRLMYGYEYKDVNVACKYAKYVVSLDKKDDWLLSKAKILIARSEFESGNYAKSRRTFQEVTQISYYEEGAEAQYYLAYLTFLDDSLLLAEEMIFELSENYRSDHFIAKAFLLLADIYIIQGNTFQAKATLESIIKNHKGEDIVNDSRKKWENIVEEQAIGEKKYVDEEYYIEILEDDIDYELETNKDSVIIDFNYEVVYPDLLNYNKDSLNIINKYNDKY